MSLLDPKRTLTAMPAEDYEADFLFYKLFCIFRIMWTQLIGLCLFVGLAGTAFFLGRAAKRGFPKIYSIVDKFLYGIDLILIVGFLAVLYFAR
jgi:hypothetical protein